MRKLIKDGLIFRKQPVIHSRDRARRSAEAKAKGRHTGYGALECWLWDMQSCSGRAGGSSAVSSTGGRSMSSSISRGAMRAAWRTLVGLRAAALELHGVRGIRTRDCYFMGAGGNFGYPTRIVRSRCVGASSHAAI